LEEERVPDRREPAGRVVDYTDTITLCVKRFLFFMTFPVCPAQAFFGSLMFAPQRRSTLIRALNA
jgi:hypothetical protein